MKRFLAGAAVLAAMAGAASGQSITTMFDSNNGGSGGWNVFFDVEVTNPAGLIFDQIDVNARNGEGSPIDLEVFVFEGSSDFSNSGGPTGSSAGWDLVATGSATAGANDVPTEITLNDTFTLMPGTWGMGIRTLGVGQNYTNGTGNNQFFSNPDLELSLGNARTGADGFGGSHFHPRVWNGTLHYTPVPAPGAAALLALGGLVAARRRRA